MKNNKGFSLVELIVVIAIMAILAAVAVVSFSLYIPKAQKANDKQLVNDILYAVELRDMETQFAADQNGVIGYVILTNDGDAYATAGEVDEAMKAVFGDNYKAELRLSYDGWTDTILMLQQVSDESIKQYIGSVNDSTYITNVGTDKLLSDVQNCATSFGTFLGELYEDDYASATNKLISGFGSGNSAVVTDLLSKAGYTDDNYDEVTPEVLQNVTVFAVASTVKKDPTAVITKFEDQSFLGKGVAKTDSLDAVATWYAAAEALVAALDDPECTKEFSKIDMTSDNAELIAASMITAHSAIQAKIEGSPELAARHQAYYAEGADGKSQATRDGEAYVAIMSSVNNLCGEYLEDESSVQSDNLFANGVMNNRVNTYIAATNLADQIQTDDQLKSLLTDKESAVVVVVCAKNGVLNCLPIPAEVTN